MSEIEAKWRINFEGHGSDIIDFMRPFKDIIVEDWHDFTEGFMRYNEGDDDFGCSHVTVRNLKDMLKILSEKSPVLFLHNIANVWISCTMQGNGVISYGCLGDHGEDRAFNEINTAHVDSDLTKKLRDIQKQLEGLIIKRD